MIDPVVLISYVTRVRVRVSDTIRIGYADIYFLKKKSTKMVYSSIRIRVSDEYRIRIRHPLGVSVYNIANQRERAVFCHSIVSTNTVPD
ncbi:hypothetical protein SORBI_3008G114800 [Sorghum bicolor]|uniref:Uncharacterized protein n=1 Tax=Sorghum bicolor TaxID=4558 RepID=A0A1B6PD42_SORBI|nr:hypothetical protein SORBI_3008G114800 [Sorghum bicolor]